VTCRDQLLGPKPAEKLQTQSGAQTALEKTFAWNCESRVLPDAFFHWDLPVAILKVQAADVSRFP